VVTALNDALNAKVGAYRDTRSTLAVEQVLQAVISRSLSATGTVAFVETAAADAGWERTRQFSGPLPCVPAAPNDWV
jgi:hypothetical protein